MASFDENGKYIKTNWKAGDKITSTKLNKIEESIEAVNDNDISRHVEADARLDALEAKDAAHDKEFTNVKNLIADNKAAAELGYYEINSRMQFLEDELNEGIEEVHNVASTVDGKIAKAESDMNNMISQTETDIENQLNQTKTDIETQLNQTKTDIETTVNDAIDTITPMMSDLSYSISEELTNNNVKSFKAGTSNVTGIDLTDRMEQSIVSLDNIEGKTEVMDNISDPTLRIKNTQVKLLYTLDENDTTNYFNNKNITSDYGDTTYTLDRNNIRVKTTSNEWRYVNVEIYGLEPGCVYRLYVDDVQITRGGSAIAMDSDANGHLLSNSFANHSTRQNFNSNGLVAKARNGKLKFEFYANLNEDSQGDVSYNDISLRKVKEYTYADLTLRSLPNGIKDEIKDGKLIKRVESYRLNGSEDWVLADNSKTNTVSFACPLLNAAPVNKEVISLNSNKYKSSSDAELYIEDVVGLAIGGLNSNQLLFRVDRGLNSVEKLKYHLANEEKDIIIEYEIKEEVYDIDLSITCLPGETVFIDTNDNLTCSHQVQLSTKSQVEETQKQIMKTNKSIWQKFKEITEKIKNLTDGEMKLEQNGYIKLPTVLGGLILQWGVVLNDKLPNVNESSYIFYNTHFTNFPYFISLTPDTVAGYDDRIYSTVDVKTQNFGIACNGGTKTSTLTTLRWFAIGK
jgi:hypothetical protein